MKGNDPEQRLQALRQARLASRPSQLQQTASVYKSQNKCCLGIDSWCHREQRIPAVLGLGIGDGTGAAGFTDEPVLGRLVGSGLAKPQEGGAKHLLGLRRDRLVPKV